MQSVANSILTDQEGENYTFLEKKSTVIIYFFVDEVFLLTDL
tara:strand:- start:395 stop:520 length:126 start_codon:yes stop_codon:yes gene_type:complete